MYFKTDPEERWDAVEEKYRLSAEGYSDGCSRIWSDLSAIEERADLIGYKEAVFHGAHVVDMGCGAGVDSLIIARLVGPEGKVIGVDTADKMVMHARSLAEALWFGTFKTRSTISSAPWPVLSLSSLFAALRLPLMIGMKFKSGLPHTSCS